MAFYSPTIWYFIVVNYALFLSGVYTIQLLAHYVPSIQPTHNNTVPPASTLYYQGWPLFVSQWQTDAMYAMYATHVVDPLDGMCYHKAMIF